MNKYVIFLLSFILAISVTGCKKNKTKPANVSNTTVQTESNQKDEAANETTPEPSKSADSNASSKNEVSDNSNSNNSTSTKHTVPEPTNRETEIFEAYLNYMMSPEHPNNLKQPENLTKEEAEKWSKEKMKKIKEYEENALKEVAKKYKITPEEVNEIYLKVWEYKLSNVPELQPN